MMGLGIGYERGSLRKPAGGRRSALGIAISVLLVVLWAAGPASAASRQWTVRNYSFVPLKLQYVKQVDDRPFGFEGRPEDGSVIPAARKELESKPGPPTAQHFELKYGANYQAFIKYRIGDTDLYVEYWIKNALSFADARCMIDKEGRVHDSGPDVYSTNWRFSDYVATSLSDLLGVPAWMDVKFKWVCEASFFNRSVDFGDNDHHRPPRRKG